MNEAVTRFAERYTEAWCRHDPEGVARFFAPNGSLTINGGSPSVGRAAIAAAAQSFITTFPDLVVTMDGLDTDGSELVYRWTLDGRSTGPGGTGRAVRISGSETWTLGSDGLILDSQGRFDPADYERQLRGGLDQ